ncbi:MAG: hypothetical protein U9R51_03210 [Actinomycetota bacterium]|nr:hypothetical protein [Actinomycetota bacterium]
MVESRCGDLTVEFADTGPRIIGLHAGGGGNLFAELPGLVIERPGAAPFTFLGGHRLWLAPEVPAVTYVPDDDAVTFTHHEGHLRSRGSADSNGTVREIDVSCNPVDGSLVIDHRIINVGDDPIETAAWAITQFPPDGAAILPLNTEAIDDGGYQANRSIVLWPYTNPGAEGFRWSRDAVILDGASGSKQKIGVENRTGWLAYHRGSQLFAKWSSRHDASYRYADRGASVQVYRDHRFIELETLSPIRRLERGDALNHREVWRVIETGPLDRADIADRVLDILSEWDPGR